MRDGLPHIPPTSPLQSLLDDLAHIKTLPEMTEAASITELSQRFLHSQAANRLRPLLPKASPQALDIILRSATIVALRGEQPLFRQGETGDALYVLMSGRLRLRIEGPTGPQALPDVRPGQPIGEFAVLTGRPRSATVIAARDSLLLKIKRKQFDALTEQFPDFAVTLAKTMAERISPTPQNARADRPRPGLAAHAKTIALAPLDDTDAFRVVERQLRRYLGDDEGVLFLDRDFFASQYDWLQGQEPIVSSLLATHEDRFALVIYVADATDSVWSARCIRQADTIFFVASDQASSKREHPLERRARRDAPATPRSLVLMHATSVQQPTHTMRWLRNDRFAEHYHVQPGDSAPMRRWGRRLTGDATGLVLSGGGARAFAHAGVWRAIQAHGLPIDYFAGTGVGALMAASFAASCEDNVPDGALFDAPTKIDRILKSYFGDRNIEDLWVPFFCVCTDLTTADAVTIDRGPLWQAVRASLSVPGLLTPVVNGPRVLADGGLVDNLPVAEMRRRCPDDRIIAVNAVPAKVRPNAFDGAVALGPAHRWLAFGRRKSPGVVSPLMRALEVNGLRQPSWNEGPAQLLIEPYAQSVGPMDHTDVPAAATAGYEAAHRKLKAWSESRSR